MDKRRSIDPQSHNALELDNKIPERITDQQILYQLEECDDLDVSDDKRQTDKTSFVQAPTERKVSGMLDNKKQKIQEFLLNHRLSLPTQRKEDEEEENLQNQIHSIQKLQRINQKSQQFILAFNKKPTDAIQKAIQRGQILDDQPKTIAEFLLGIQGLDKTVLGEYFGKNNQKVLKILHEYCNLLNFYNMQFDIALRKLLSKFRLPGQAQQIQRVIWQFSLSFYQQNKGSYDNADQLFPLAYSIIMLATDAHNPKQQKKMSMSQFVRNTQRPCPTIGKQYLEHIYNRITKQKLQTQNSYWEMIYARLRDMDEMPKIMEALKNTKQLMKGDVVLKICRDTNKLPFGNPKQSKFVQRRIFLSDDQQRINWVVDPPKQGQEPRFIEIKDIIDLTLGIAPHLKKNNKVPKQFDSLCFTITTTYRHLDLKAKSTKQRSKWLNYLRAVMIQRRQLKKQDLQSKHKARFSPQAVEQAWNGDIFPNWDKYWDYSIKKPQKKSYFVRGFEALCCCFQSNSQNSDHQAENHHLGLEIKNNLLQTLWKYGLPKSSRKTLWVEIIGNSLQLNKIIIEDIKKRRIKSAKLRGLGQYSSQMIEMTQFLITLRPDLPHVSDLLQMSKVFCENIPQVNPKSALQSNLPTQKNYNRLIALSNLIHKHHFLSFYRGQKFQIQLRTKLFQFLLQKNCSSVLDHFKAIKLETRMYLVKWFLSGFASSFKQQFLYRIWDNFLLQGQVYLFKIGITLIKYYQTQLKMCTFFQGLNLLKNPKQQTSAVLFFHILQKQIDVSSQHYHDYIQKRKHAVIKTKVQSIPLE